MFRPCGQFNNNIVNKQGVFDGFFSILLVHNTSGWLPLNKTNRQSVTTAHPVSSVHSYMFRLYVIAVIGLHWRNMSLFVLITGCAVVTDCLLVSLTENTTQMNSLITERGCGCHTQASMCSCCYIMLFITGPEVSGCLANDSLLTLN